MARRRIRARTIGTMAAASARKGTTRPGSKAHARAERKEHARGRLPAPGTAAAKRIRDRYLPDTDEVRWLRNAATAVTLDRAFDPRKDVNEYARDLDAMADRLYRQAFGARQKERRAAGKLKAAKPRPKSANIRVRAHWRRRPGGGS